MFVVNEAWGLHQTFRVMNITFYLQIIIRIVERSVEGDSGSSVQALTQGVGGTEVHRLVQRLCLRRQKVFSETAKGRYLLLDKHRFIFSVTFCQSLGKLSNLLKNQNQEPKTKETKAKYNSTGSLRIVPLS